MTKPPIGTQRDCRKHNSSARKEIHGIMFQSVPKSNLVGNWITDNGRVAISKKKKDGSPWKVYVDGQLVGNDQLTNLIECIHANEYFIRPASL